MNEFEIMVEAGVGEHSSISASKSAADDDGPEQIVIEINAEDNYIGLIREKYEQLDRHIREVMGWTP